MIKFFRKIRQKLLTENKFSKYLIYAIGEIILVVIGILIALQINNNNETKKSNKRLDNYEQSLITELNDDLKSLNELDSLCNIYLESIKNYNDYYNTKNPDINILVQKLDSIKMVKNLFNTRAYTIEDLISTGNLSLFEISIKNAILQLKDTQEIYEFYERQSTSNLYDKELEFNNSLDALFNNGFSKKEHSSVKDWKYNLNSIQHRLNNNRIAQALILFNYQIMIHERIRKDTEALLGLLEK